MRILIAVFVFVGLAAVINAAANRQPLDPFLAEPYPFELYPIPSRENRSLENFVAVSCLVLYDANMYSLKVVNYLMDVESGKPVLTTETAEIEKQVLHWQNVVENAWSFIDETTEQLKSAVMPSNVNYTIDMYELFFRQLREYRYWPDSLCRFLQQMLREGFKYHKEDISSALREFGKVNDNLILINKNVAELIEYNGIRSSLFHRKQLERYGAVYLWTLTGVVPSQEKVNEAVEKYIEQHGYYMPIYDGLKHI
uniref:Uncharacterized protein n=1 Tax=Panagrellus redivivus TaxID=6233 RepID=A0A7E4W430_PANRE